MIPLVTKADHPHHPNKTPWFTNGRSLLSQLAPHAMASSVHHWGPWPFVGPATLQLLNDSRDGEVERETDDEIEREGDSETGG